MNNTYKIIKLTEEITEHLKNNCRIKNTNIDGMSTSYKRGEFLHATYYQTRNTTIISIINHKNTYNKILDGNQYLYKNLFIINDDGFCFGDFDMERFEYNPDFVEEIKDMDDTQLVLTFGRESLLGDEIVSALLIINEQFISSN